jgi:hypothetical protein
MSIIPRGPTRIWIAAAVAGAGVIGLVARVLWRRRGRHAARAEQGPAFATGAITADLPGAQHLPEKGAGPIFQVRGSTP